MFRTILALLTIGISCTSALVCNVTTFKDCQNSFANALQINVDIDWKTPDELLTAIQNVYINDLNGGNGLVAVCNAYNKLVKCLNTAGLVPGDCINGLWLLSNDDTPDDAYGYAMLMRQVEWQCGAGFYPGFDNWACIKRVYQNWNTTLTSCIRNFRIHAAEDPLQQCKYASQGMTCYRKPFYETCYEPAVEYYGCESFRQYIDFEFPQCSEYCTVRS